MTVKLQRVKPGLYRTPDGKFRVERDDYEPMRSDEQIARIEQGDKRFTGSASGGGWSPYRAAPEGKLYYSNPEACWIVFEGDSEDHHGNIFDTLREAREHIAREYHKLNNRKEEGNDHA